MNIFEDFSSPSINTNIWQASIKAGSSITIENGWCRIRQFSGWAGAALQTREKMSPQELFKNITAEFDMYMFGMNYNQNGASINPFIGFVNPASPRGFHYNDTSNHMNLIMQVHQTFFRFVHKGAGNHNYISVGRDSITSVVGNGSQNRIKIECNNYDLKIYVNGAEQMNLLITEQMMNRIGNLCHVEFYLGNYQPGNSMYINNVSIKTSPLQILNFKTDFNNNYLVSASVLHSEDSKIKKKLFVNDILV